jgi:hypothetical protein
MMQKTIKFISKPRASGNAFYVNGSFDDASGFSAYAKTEADGQKVVEQLTPLVGKPNDFDIEDTGREYQGQKQFKLKGWPGKPASGGGGYGGRGGGGNFTPAYGNTKEGHAETQWSIQSQVALKCAVELAVAGKIGMTTKLVLDYAEEFRAFLAEKPPAAPADPLAGFEKAIEAANMARKEAGVKLVDALALAEAVALRQWPNPGFKNRADFVKMLGPDRLKKLEADMDSNPTKFEKEARA